jgi:hypothetical protein
MARVPHLPPDADLLAPPGHLDFLDSQSLALPAPLTAIEAWNQIMQRPLPLMGLAFRIRDAISTRFGVQRIGGFSGRSQTTPQVGQMLDFFRVERATPQMLTLTARDRHLDVMTCVTSRDGRLAITASVVTHNWFGRAYMWPVAPAHRLIVWLMLRRLSRQMSADVTGKA